MVCLLTLITQWCSKMNYLIIVIGLVYFAIGVTQLMKGSVPNFIIYTGYAFSNIGLFMMAK